MTADSTDQNASVAGPFIKVDGKVLGRRRPLFTDLDCALATCEWGE